MPGAGAWTPWRPVKRDPMTPESQGVIDRLPPHRPLNPEDEGKLRQLGRAVIRTEAAAVAAQTGVKERTIRDWCEHELITEQGNRGQVLMGAQESQGLSNDAIHLLQNAYLVRAEKRLEL